eukprot:m.607908 g.607908  ORF g.607908 m.607908 type:complete len:1017 (-) comp58121_c0_seq16:591-3641(-)
MEVTAGAEVRALNAKLRAEQLRAWRDMPADPPKERAARAVQFPRGVELLSAAAAGDSGELARILALGTSPNCRNADGLTPLHQVCIDGRPDLAAILLKAGADIACKDNEWWTPLHAASNVETLKFLLENGAEIEARNLDNQTALDIARESDEDDAKTVVQFLTEQYRARGLNPDAKPPTKQNTQLEQMLKADARARVTNNLNINDPVEDGATLLHIAAANGYHDLVEYLLRYGANINAQDDDGWTPLHAAVSWGHIFVVKKLCLYRANPDIKSRMGEFFYDVVDPENEEMVKLVAAVRAESAVVPLSRVASGNPSEKSSDAEEGDLGTLLEAAVSDSDTEDVFKPKLKSRSSVTRTNNQVRLTLSQTDKRSERAIFSVDSGDEDAPIPPVAAEKVRRVKFTPQRAPPRSSTLHNQESIPDESPRRHSSVSSRRSGMRISSSATSIPEQPSASTSSSSSSFSRGPSGSPAAAPPVTAPSASTDESKATKANSSAKLHINIPARRTSSSSDSPASPMTPQTATETKSFSAVTNTSAPTKTSAAAPSNSITSSDSTRPRSNAFDRSPSGGRSATAASSSATASVPVVAPAASSASTSAAVSSTATPAVEPATGRAPSSTLAASPSTTELIEALRQRRNTADRPTLGAVANKIGMFNKPGSSATLAAPPPVNNRRTSFSTSASKSTSLDFARPAPASDYPRQQSVPATISPQKQAASASASVPQPTGSPTSSGEHSLSVSKQKSTAALGVQPVSSPSATRQRFASMSTIRSRIDVQAVRESAIVESATPPAVADPAPATTAASGSPTIQTPIPASLSSPSPEPLAVTVLASTPPQDSDAEKRTEPDSVSNSSPTADDQSASPQPRPGARSSRSSSPGTHQLLLSLNSTIESQKSALAQLGAENQTLKNLLASALTQLGEARTEIKRIQTQQEQDIVALLRQSFAATDTALSATEVTISAGYFSHPLQFMFVLFFFSKLSLTQAATIDRGSVSLDHQHRITAQSIRRASSPIGLRASPVSK